MSAEQLFDPSC